MSLRGVHALVASIEEKVTQLTYRFRVFPGFTVQFNSRFGQARFRQSRKASNWCWWWCCWLRRAGDILCEDNVAILGQLCESSFVKHAAWILMCEGVCPRTCCKHWRASDSIEFTYFGYYSQGLPWNSIGGFDSQAWFLQFREGMQLVLCCGLRCAGGNFVRTTSFEKFCKNHTAWIWIECESVHGLVASIELASWGGHQSEELFIVLRPTMTPARC